MKRKEVEKRKSKKFIYAVNFLFFTAISVLNYFYQKNGFIFSLKCVCSVAFVLMALANILYVYGSKGVDKSFCKLILTGFVLAMMGDIIIAFHFIGGAASFALGHVFFLLAYIKLQKYRKSDLCISAMLCLCTGCFLLFCPLLTFSSTVLKAVCLAYAFVISTMFGKALGNFFHLKKSYAAAMAGGSLLFFFSDLMLCLSKFSNIQTVTDYLCMGTYYPALCVLAFSVLLYGMDRVERG